MPYTIEEVLDIDVGPEVAFDALVDHDSWPLWMPAEFLPVGPSVGTLRVGAKAKIRIDRLPFASTLRVTVVDRPREITWSGGRRGTLYAEHRFLFAAKGAGTRVTSLETWSGWLSVLLKPILYPGAVRVGRAQLAGIRKGAIERGSSIPKDARGPTP